MAAKELEEVTLEGVVFTTDMLDSLLGLPNPDKSIVIEYYGLFDRPKKSMPELCDYWGKSSTELYTRLRLSVDTIRG